MQIVRHSEAERFANADNCHGLEYGFSDKTMNGALITIEGRFPSDNWIVNEVCTELAYIVRGAGAVITEAGCQDFSVGDTLLLQAGEKYYWDADCDVYVVCSPAFYPEQHKEVG